MLTITQRLEPEPQGASAAQGSLTLPFELRCRSRLRTRLDDGSEAALYLPRGEVLRGGDLLCAEDGTTVRVVAAPESVSTARTDDPLLLARASYHLGNRHIALQIGPGWLRYLHDHVLDDMVRGLGLQVVAENAPFEPEPGAYPGGHGHSHGEHAHGHGDHGHHHGDHAHTERLGYGH